MNRTVRRSDALRARTEAVVDAVAEVFVDLRDATIREVAYNAVLDQLLGADAPFEFLLTTSGSWRLKNNDEVPGTFRVADYRLYSTTPRDVVEDLNARLARLTA